MEITSKESPRTSQHRRRRNASSNEEPDKWGGFSGALRRAPPAMPPALLRRIGIKEVQGIGKVKVMLRVTDNSRNPENVLPPFFNVDARKKQVTLFDPAVCTSWSAPEERRVAVAAPKMFAFDAIFTQDDSQAEICSTALTEIIHAVINGSDGCIFCFGHSKLGKTGTMLGMPESSNTLGIIPSAISWLFRGIHEQKQKTGDRFSVRVSALQVCQQRIRDLLSTHAHESEESPGVFLREDPLFGTQLQHQSELRVSNAEKAAFYLDAAISAKEEGRDSHFLYTLHVYQYSVAGKGGVAGGRSRLHLIDLGSCDKSKANGGIPLSGLGNVLLAIFNGRKHLPYREHKITQLLKECLSSVTCHAAVIAHVSQSAKHYTDTLTTVQLASRIHRMRRKRFKFCGQPSSTSTGNSSDELPRQNVSTGNSDVDPSSSEQSADTVIYVGPADEAATDGEHPPVYIPSLNSGDNRCVMSKALRGSGAEMRPAPIRSKPFSTSKTTAEKASGSPLHRCIKPCFGSLKTGSLRATNSEEQWIDGPRVSKQRIAEARNILLKEHIKKETWIDGPLHVSPKFTNTANHNNNNNKLTFKKNAVSSNNQNNSNSNDNNDNNQCGGCYGFMDSHKKTMIRKWVENQTVNLKQSVGTTSKLEISKNTDSEKLSERHIEGSPKPDRILMEESTETKVTVGTAVIKQTNACLKELKKEDVAAAAACGQFSESSEEEKLPSPLPIILHYGNQLSLGDETKLVNKPKMGDGLTEEGDDDDDDDDEEDEEDEDEDEDEIELEIVEVMDVQDPVPMQDSCLQVTEEDIAFCMEDIENPLPEVDQESHPLHILSQENLTLASSFNDCMEMEIEGILRRPLYGPPSLLDGPLKVKSELTEAGGRCQSSLSLCDVPEGNELLNGSGSIYSEPAYWPVEKGHSVCSNCKRTFDDVERKVSSLRHPDGASNPNLNDNETKNKIPGTGSSRSDYEEESKEKGTTRKKVVSSDIRRGIGKTNHSSCKTFHDSTKQTKKSNESSKTSNEMGKSNETTLKFSNSSTRNVKSESRKNSKSGRIEQNPFKVLTQRHLYLNKACRSLEGSDSGHESSTSPKMGKISGRRAGTQLQCESSGYESVLSFASSLETEVGVNLIREDSERVDDPEAHTAWWCWCVSGRQNPIGNGKRRLHPPFLKD